MAANPSAEIEAFQLDLSDYQSALGFCQEAKEEVPELDILLCNAGLNIVKYEENKSGHEMVMQGIIQNKSSRDFQLEAVANVLQSS
jgi:NADP-dependent 3-hydroxy acid dehydrogenase YdfG